MFKKLFGTKRQDEVPDKRTLTKWLFLGDSNPRRVQDLLRSFLTAFLEMLDRDGIVERRASAIDLEGNGADYIKSKVVKLMSGPAPGHVEMPLTPSQMSVAEKIYDEIRLSRYGDLYAAGMSIALFNAMMLWCVDKYEDSVAIATHVIDDIAPDAGEAYRIRAFSYISLGRLNEAITDLRKALASTPQPNGAIEPLTAIEKVLTERTTDNQEHPRL
jgi:tetratricopeptide (TPR) repeat protein